MYRCILLVYFLFDSFLYFIRFGSLSFTLVSVLGICCYVYLFYVLTEPIIISSHALSRIELQLILCGSLLIIYYLFGVLDRFLYMLLICFVVCGVHSIFRQKSLKAGFTILAEDTSIF